MNLLITNCQAAQSYAILRALRPYADRVVATMTGGNRWKARTSHTANSRYVDRRYYVPDPSVDWLAGVMQPTNTKNEEAYVRRIEEICEVERIDTIFPSSDAEVCILSKNRPRFARLGVVCVAQDYGSLAIPLDKFETFQAARSVGLPVPETIVPSALEEVRAFAERVAPPWLVKPRCTFGGIGTKIVRRREDLETTFSMTAQQKARPMLQEFIPGRVKESIYVVTDRDAQIRSFMRTDFLKGRQRMFNDSMSSFRISVESPLRDRVQALMREIGTWGGFTFQFKVDARDGVAKLLEVNPRLGRHLWSMTLAGVNVPLLLVRMARGEAIETARYPDGAIVFEPIEDLMDVPFELLDLFVYRVRTRLLGYTPTDPSNPPYTLRELVSAFATNYAPGPKVISIYSRYLLEDPLACGLALYAYLGSLLRTAGRRGQ